MREVYGNTHSENGWPMCNRNECDLIPMQWMDTAPIRRGAPFIILGDFARRYHEEVDQLSNSVWGWSRENDVPDSNHLSGTALDLNASKWPWKRYTMPPEIVHRIENLLTYYEGTIWWGGWWDTVDQMHFQMNRPEGHLDNERIVNKILNPGKPRPRHSRNVTEGFMQLIPPSLWPRP